MPRQRVWPPKVHHHKPSGQDRITLWVGGRRVFVALGPHDSEEARREYLRVVAEHEHGKRPPVTAESLTVGELVAAYRPHSEATLDSGELWHTKRALKPLLALYADYPVADFGQAELRVVRGEMVKDKLVGRYINRLVSRIRRLWKWAVGERLVPPDLHHGLTLLEPLRSSTKGVRWHRPVGEVPRATVEKTLPFLQPVPAAMVRLQTLTGMRPGEVCRLRPGDIDREGIDVDGVKVWVYTPGSHKKEYEGKLRLIPLGPQAQAVLAPYLDRPADAYCFSPKESVEAYMRQMGRKINHAARRKPGEKYTPSSYEHAVKKACKRAGVQPWHPHQLRHQTATLVQGKMSLDEARALLGHQHADITRVYAHGDLIIAARVVARLG